jgi:hypothetical protein
LQEIRRQVQGFRISTWCPDPGTRDEVAPVVDLAVGAVNFLPLADGSFGRVRFADVTVSDGGADTGLYRRDLVYDVEYPTTLAQMTPAMLFGTAAVSANAVLVGNFED